MGGMTGSRIEIGLVLQGGGALGAYECGAVTALLELLDEAAMIGAPVALKTVSGVSIGAINAACVVGAVDNGDARRRLNALWDDLTLVAPEFWPREVQRDLALFGLPGFYLPRMDYFSFGRWTSYYDTSPLLATLQKHVDFAELNGGATALVISAVDVESGELKRFSNVALPCATQTELTARHLLASGSLPPQFPWTVIDHRLYWDGGLVNNTPFGDAIQGFSHGKDVERVLVMMDLYPLHGHKPRSMADVEDRAHELAFGNRLRQDHQFADHINALIETVERLAPLVPPSEITPELQRRIDDAREYKQITIIDIDMQARQRGPEDPVDDKDGLRDFSADTVKRRRTQGYRKAHARLLPFFIDRNLIPSDPVRPLAMPARS